MRIKRPKIKSKAGEKAVEIKVKKDNEKCCLCHHPKLSGNEIEEAGKFFEFAGSYYHYFCLLFCRNVAQKGRDEEGLNGFRLEDIRAGLKQANSTTCTHCQRRGAGTRCKACNIAYHFVCGLKNDAAFVFVGSMESFCSQHLPVQKNVKLRGEDKTCLAGCQELVQRHERSLISPCCGRILHLNCLQQMALQYGNAHYKCPQCADKKKFVMVSKNLGIYVPVMDASWELPEHEDFYNFQQMGRLYAHCDATRCLCKSGRTANRLGTEFEIIRCEKCGSKAVHVRCGDLLKQAPFFVCDDHDGAEQEMAENRRATLKRLRNENISTCAEDSESSSPDSSGVNSGPSKKRSSSDVSLNDISSNDFSSSLSSGVDHQKRRPASSRRRTIKQRNNRKRVAHKNDVISKALPSTQSATRADVKDVDVIEIDDDDVDVGQDVQEDERLAHTVPNNPNASQSRSVVNSSVHKPKPTKSPSPIRVSIHKAPDLIDLSSSDSEAETETDKRNPQSNWILIDKMRKELLDIFDSEKCVKACPVMASDSNLVRQPFSFVDVETNENIPLLVKPFTMSQDLGVRRSTEPSHSNLRTVQNRVNVTLEPVASTSKAGNDFVLPIIGQTFSLQPVEAEVEDDVIVLD